MRRLWVAVAAAALAAACEQHVPERQIVADAAAALGGADRVAAVRTLALEGEGVQYNLGQDMRPDAAGQTFRVSDYRRLIDTGARRARTELTRTPEFTFFQGQAPQRQTMGLDGDVAYNITPSGAVVRASETVARERRLELYQHPMTAVQAALAPGSTVANPRTTAGERLVDVTTEDGVAFTLAVDQSGLPVRVESATSHPNLGDIVSSTSFADYEDVSGLRLPSRLIVRVDDFTTAEYRVRRQALDEEVGDLAAPADVAAAAAPAPPAPNVVPEEVAPGVWLMAGQSHHSALIELSDRLVLVDAPQSEARTLAVIEQARELRADKPLTTLIMTHHHFDHTAGLRAAIAEGLAVLTHRGNGAFVEAMAARAHTLQPDALARNPRPVTVETFDDEHVIEDSLRTVALYHVAGNPHSDTMLMVHLPAERLIIQVDAYSPAAAVHPFAPNLLDNIQQRNLRVDRIVPLHGNVVPFAELVKAAGGTN